VERSSEKAGPPILQRLRVEKLVVYFDHRLVVLKLTDGFHQATFLHQLPPWSLPWLSSPFLSPLSCALLCCVQDHIVGAALLTQRDTFLTRSEYSHLVYAGCGPLRTTAVPAKTVDGKPSCVHKIYDEAPVHLLPPALVRPVPLWTGKQVVGALSRSRAAFCTVTERMVDAPTPQRLLGSNRCMLSC
jgi:hypothetical protein